ncbi:uncharacterized protein LOC141630180 [Silene latifolia]|uniref:uncharacterized protein LOC141630180 n=1 Tax=Silene latifolia TaxID=37657 RepID=UPI003D781AC3
MVLVDDGSAVNVIPLKTARKLGIKEDDLVLTNQGVRAYDGTHRTAISLNTLTIATGPLERQVNFQVVNIEASFIMILGHPWIHAAKAVTSTFHQKIMVPFYGKMITIPGSPIKAFIQVTEEANDEIWGFQAVNALTDDPTTFDYDPF